LAVKSDPQDEAFRAASKALLDERARELDADLAARLRQARYRALEAKPRPFFWLVPAGGLAAACVAVLAVALWWYQPSRPVPVQGVEDLEILGSSENLELFDDLEFYGWLAERDRTG
jgi:hypothetical protein